MKSYSLGSEELCDSDLEPLVQSGKYEWMVYFWERKCHFGEGEAVCLGKDGLLYTATLGDCTFYGPLEGGCSFEPLSIEEFLRPKDSIFDFECKDAIDKKVRELLAQA